MIINIVYFHKIKELMNKTSFAQIIHQGFVGGGAYLFSQQGLFHLMLICFVIIMWNLYQLETILLNRQMKIVCPKTASLLTL